MGCRRERRRQARSWCAQKKRESATCLVCVRKLYRTQQAENHTTQQRRKNGTFRGLVLVSSSLQIKHSRNPAVLLLIALTQVSLTLRWSGNAEFLQVRPPRCLLFNYKSCLSQVPPQPPATSQPHLARNISLFIRLSAALKQPITVVSWPVWIQFVWLVGRRNRHR